MFRTVMSIFCNESTHLSDKPECQQKGLNWSISFIPGPFVGYQRPGDLLIRVLSWSSFSERGAGELSAGNTRICSRANKNNSRKRGEDTGWGRGRGQPGGSLILDGLACPVFSSWPCHGRDLPQWLPAQYSILHIYMEFRKMVTTTLYARQKKRHRCTEQTLGLYGRRRGWDVLREQHWNKYTIKGETDHQPRRDAWDKC